MQINIDTALVLKNKTHGVQPKVTHVTPTSETKVKLNGAVIIYEVSNQE